MNDLIRYPLMLLALFAAAPAIACRCADRDLNEHLAAADYVVIAEVIAITRLSNREIPALQYGIKSHRQIKGAAVTDVYTSDSTASCGVSAERGEILWLFAYTLPSDSETAVENPWVDSCSGSRRLSQGFNELSPVQALQQLAPAEPELNTAEPASVSVQTIDSNRLHNELRQAVDERALVSPNGHWRAAWLQATESISTSSLIVDRETAEWLKLDLEAHWALLELQWINERWLYLNLVSLRPDAVQLELVLDGVSAQILLEARTLSSE